MYKGKLSVRLMTLMLIVGSISDISTVLPNAYAATVPVPWASVIATGPDGYGYAASNAQGFYNITDGLGSGSYSVSASARGYIDTKIENVSITAGSERTNVNVLMPVSGGISGTITDAVTSAPVPSVSVSAENITGDAYYASGGFTDATGNYQIITNLQTGTYNVTAFPATGYIRKEIIGVSVTAGVMTSNVKIALDRSGIITGTVTDSVSSAVLESVQVFAFDSSGAYSSSDMTDPSGKYTLSTDLSTGTYNVTVMHPANHIEKTVSGVAVTAGSTTTVNFALDRSGIISGRITNAANGQPLAETEVIAGKSDFSGAGPLSHATTNDTGHYRITDNLGTGTYNVTALYQVGSNIGFNMTMVSVTQGLETPNVDLQITLTPFGTTVGRVTNSTGYSVQYAEVVAESLATLVSGRISGQILAEALPIPEFPPLMMLPSLMILTLAATGLLKKRRQT